jgi:polysaccharide biosynthesis/export protein
MEGIAYMTRRISFGLWKKAQSRETARDRLLLDCFRVAALNVFFAAYACCPTLSFALMQGLDRGSSEQNRSSISDTSAAENKTASETAADRSHNGETAANRKEAPDSVPTRVDATPKPAGSPDANGYVIGEQDQLTITVWKEKELSTSVVVRPDGKITVPLVGDVRVIGMTTLQLQALLSEKLKPFITVPQVTVAVSQINSRKIYLIGQVMREGTFPLNSSTTILQVIAEAGGLKDFAKRKNIYVLRQSENGEERYQFNYDAVIRGKKQEQNILLQPGDTIVVP